MFVDCAPKTDDENKESRDVIPASRFMAQRFAGVGRLYYFVNITAGKLHLVGLLG